MTRSHRIFGVQNRNTDVQRHMKLQLNLVFRKKLARIQAAGVNVFVKSRNKSLETDAEKPAMK
jgi:hypothetical protein